jgi:hypothetical protein
MTYEWRRSSREEYVWIAGYMSVNISLHRVLRPAYVSSGKQLGISRVLGIIHHPRQHVILLDCSEPPAVTAANKDLLASPGNLCRTLESTLGDARSQGRAEWLRARQRLAKG